MASVGATTWNKGGLDDPRLKRFVAVNIRKAKFLWTFSIRGGLGKFVLEMTRGYLSQPHSESTSSLQADSKMNLFILTIVLVLPLLSYQNPTRTWTLLPHILVVDVDGTLGQQPLSCMEQPENLTRTDNQSRDIFWKRDGREEVQTGNSYLVQLEESLGGGNYTCHSEDGSLLNYTLVLIQEDATKRKKILVQDDQADYLSCFAPNYSGAFRCSWTWHSSRVGRVAFIKARRVSDDGSTHCSLDPHQQRWICSSAQRNFSCSVSDSGDGMSCLDEQHCPYAEESQQIYITVYVRTEHSLLENYSKLFYLSDIVKPGKVRIGKVNTTLIQWSYPSFWSSPHSYFPLTFQIAQFRSRCKRCDNPCTQSQPSKKLPLHSTDICQFEVKRKTKAVCVRAKDAFCDSQWSEWSHVRLRRDRRKNRRSKQPNKEQT